ncbi:MAG: formate--phosphoribosylaminoimidazolecarboxamide ligase [Candidatus Micrarchaeota archaeon]
MISREEINAMLKKYDHKKIALATLCSHSSLQIFHGAKQEGFRTIGIVERENRGTYDAFPLARPDEYIELEKFSELPKLCERLASENAILVPHGSLVEYLGASLLDLEIPIFGNRRCLEWERDRAKMLEWMRQSGMRLPRTLSPDKIDRVCIVKFPGARGGKGYLLVQDEKDFHKKINGALKARAITEDDVRRAVIQEYVIGVRFYPHYFYSPLSADGFKAGEGRLELMSIDKRFETNIDEIYRPMASGITPRPSFTVAGNLPLVLRESLLHDIFKIGKSAVETSIKLFGGIPGPFCIETVCDENLKFTAFEISARIVAGTNLYPLGSQYSPYMFGAPMSTGRRIAVELKSALKTDRMEKVVY